MKNHILSCFLALAGIALFSCNKGDSPIPPPPGPTTPPPPTAQDSLLKSFSIYNPQLHSKVLEVFGYDSQTQLAAIHAYSYDSSSGTPVVDSILISLTLTAALAPPSAYDATYHQQGDPPAGQSEHHSLFYDSQSRVINDSITVSTVSSFGVQHYSYDNNGNTTVEWLFGDPQTPGSYTVNQIDTMFIANESILTDINYSSPGGAFNHLFTRSYTTQINPLYNAALANSLGCLMVFNNFSDFRSKYLPTQFTDQESGSPTVVLNYSWTADAAGRIVKGVGTDGSNQQIYSFNY